MQIFAVVTAADIRELFEKDGLKYLSEMMNFPGVLFRDEMVMEKFVLHMNSDDLWTVMHPDCGGADAENIFLPEFLPTTSVLRSKKHG